MTRYYNVVIQVDFDTPREMPPLPGKGKPWRAVGYFRQIFCTENSKDKAKALALKFVRENEELAPTCQFRFECVAWMRWVENSEPIAFGSAAGLTEEMFAKRNEIRIWFHGEKECSANSSIQPTRCKDARGPGAFPRATNRPAWAPPEARVSRR